MKNVNVNGVEWFFHRKASAKRPGVEVFYFSKVAQDGAEIPQGYDVFVNPKSGVPVLMKAGVSPEQKYLAAIKRRDRSISRKAEAVEKFLSTKRKVRKYKKLVTKLTNSTKTMDTILAKNKKRVAKMEKRIVKVKELNTKRLATATARLAKAQELSTKRKGLIPSMKKTPVKLVRLADYAAFAAAKKAAAAVVVPAPAPVAPVKKAKK